MNIQITLSRVSVDELADVCTTFSPCRVEEIAVQEYRVTTEWRRDDAAWQATQLNWLADLRKQANQANPL